MFYDRVKLTKRHRFSIWKCGEIKQLLVPISQRIEKKRIVFAQPLARAATLAFGMCEAGHKA